MKNNSYKINIEKDRPIINILGEVCYGFQIDEFEKKIGVDKNIAEILLEKLLKAEKDEISEISLSYAEINIVKRALYEVEKEIEEWEFYTRIGVNIEQVREIESLK